MIVSRSPRNNRLSLSDVVARLEAFVVAMISAFASGRATPSDGRTGSFSMIALTSSAGEWGSGAVGMLTGQQYGDKCVPSPSSVAPYVPKLPASRQFSANEKPQKNFKST